MRNTTRPISVQGDAGGRRRKSAGSTGSLRSPGDASRRRGKFNRLAPLARRRFASPEKDQQARSARLATLRVAGENSTGSLRSPGDASKFDQKSCTK